MSFDAFMMSTRGEWRQAEPCEPPPQQIHGRRPEGERVTPRHQTDRGRIEIRRFSAHSYTVHRPDGAKIGWIEHRDRWVEDRDPNFTWSGAVNIDGRTFAARGHETVRACAEALGLPAWPAPVAGASRPPQFTGVGPPERR